MRENICGGEPVFLVGSERSGSTLLGHMLDHHPHLGWAQGFEFTVAHVREPGQWPSARQYRDYLDTNRIFQTSGLQVDPRLGYLEQMHDFLAQVRRRKNKPRAGATVHRHFDRLPWIYSDCRFLHLFRDPRDVSRSAVGLGFVGNVWRGACWWREAEQQWEALRRRLSPDRHHDVRYESLVRDPEATLREVCAFIGISYSEQMLAYPRDTRYRPPDANLVEQWRRFMAPREVRIVEAVVAPMLAARGYALSGLPPLRIGPLYRLYLREDDRYRRVHRRVARNGFGLTAADFLGRHLHLRPIARRARKRLNAIEERKLL